jgi:hypothetical protein
MKELLCFKDQTSGKFVVSSDLKWKSVEYMRYRCEPHWRVLIEWLEVNSISARQKVHELRKLFGDAIVKRNGIFTGSAQLRHASIQMTANHYTDPRQRAALPVGNLFSVDATEIVPDHQLQAERSTQKLRTKSSKIGVKNRV